ncbi:uncharacterized protein EDB91DRAFT_1059330 [Suillus paluster]|uniref:uncharacterized protein n=1 Tax=Suillus paluster TaxID=48578 RepID=UPI001B85FCEF|nr:uncharacterized protein EDB91DRAFT_1059330 [Suillus paluster]KAG1730671.1 hypothetical protein EDB91DRAFT_1059330 [Suillus paluster]
MPVSCLSVLKLFLHANYQLVAVAPDVPIVSQRQAYLEKPSESPSSAAMPSAISKAQDQDKPEFLCSRPRKAEDPVPVTLLHPIFAEFVDDCRDLKPTHHDYRFVRELSEKMCIFPPDENARMDVFRTQLAYFYPHVTLYAAAVGAKSYRTDCHLIIGGKFVAVIVEGKKEIGGSGAEPFVEAMWYQRQFMKILNNTEFDIAERRSVFPCFHIIVFGTCISIVGSVLTRKVQCNILGPIIPLFWHSMDDSMQSTAARMFAALNLAITKLAKLYSAQIPLLTPQDSPLDCPYPQDYDNGTQYFSYYHSQPLRHHRIFFEETSIGEKICIKYVKRYLPEAHQFCAKEGHAPRLIAYESLPGGWNMVVMNVLPIHNDLSSRSTSAYQQFSQIPAAECGPLEKAVTDFIHQFHKKDFIHGDLRGTNLFLLGDNFMLLDFDWSGRIGNTHYPMHVNCKGIHRPFDARDGNEIKVVHDLEMLRHVFHPEEVAMGAPCGW